MNEYAVDMRWVILIAMCLTSIKLVRIARESDIDISNDTTGTGIYIANLVIWWRKPVMVPHHTADAGGLRGTDLSVQQRRSPPAFVATEVVLPLLPYATMLRNGWKSVACLARVGLAPRRSCGLATLRHGVGAYERARSPATPTVDSDERQGAAK